MIFTGMNMKFLFFTLLLSCNIYSKASAQPVDTSAKINTVDSNSSSGNNSLLTIVYNIQVNTSKHKAGIEETYNGGIKTIFIDNEKARIRLVSLMRIQSIFFSSSNKSNHFVSVVKESGKNKYKYYLTNEQWDLYNNKYENDSCQLTNDSAVVLNYPCRKAIIMLKDGRLLVVYYTNQLKPINPEIEPAFSHIPGLVLKYEYDYKKGTLLYTASKISEDPIDNKVFKAPSGLPVKKYCQKCKVKEKILSENSGIE
jgi:GLPGLI family protein